MFYILEKNIWHHIIFSFATFSISKTHNTFLKTLKFSTIHLKFLTIHLNFSTIHLKNIKYLNYLTNIMF